MPLISICIPAYKRIEGLQRLLKSIEIQTFTDYETIITDDSNDNTVKNFISNISPQSKITYVKNEFPLGSPANWNKAISLTSGKWIKIMHDDDWFASANSLQNFVNHINDKHDLIFSAYTNMHLANNYTQKSSFSFVERSLLKFSPYNLFKKNFIGHPSTTLIKNDQTFWFDETIKWVVDFEFYIRLLKKNSNFFYIEKHLVNIGISDTQITKQAFRNSEIEIPENIYLLNKLGINVLKNIFVYDYYWRLIRNLSIKSVDQLTLYLTRSKLPKPIARIILQQKNIPAAILRTGLFSKFLMFLSYLRNILLK